MQPDDADFTSDFLLLTPYRIEETWSDHACKTFNPQVSYFTYSVVIWTLRRWARGIPWWHSTHSTPAIVLTCWIFSCCTVTRFICWVSEWDPISGVWSPFTTTNSTLHFLLFLGLRMLTRHVPKTGMVDLLYNFKVRSDSTMFVPDRTNFCGKTLHEAPVSICIWTLFFLQFPL